MATDPRPTLSVRKKASLTIDDIVAMDLEELMLNPKFLRFLFTTFRDAHMYTGSFHPEAGILTFAEGRRGLGLDILRRCEQSCPDAHIRILSEAQPYKEAKNGRRNYDPRTELDRDGDDGNVDGSSDD